MGKTSGIGDESFKPAEPVHLGVEKGSSGDKGMEAALHTGVRTTGELKQLLIKSLGEKDGKKLYNSFMQSIGMMMLSQVQKSAEHAKKAAQEMRVRR